MNSCKLFILIIILSLLFFLLPQRWIKLYGQEEKINISFRWAFGAIIGPENDQRLVAITRDTILKTGDKLKMLIKKERDCFIYLIYLSFEGEFDMLFPYTPKMYDIDHNNQSTYYIPQDEIWFELDENVGLEKFYLLASAQRLTGLEDLFEEYNNPSKKDIKDLAKKIINEIRSVKKKHLKLASSAERPIQIGGSLRQVDRENNAYLPDIDSVAEEVSAIDFYSRTFTIEHQ